MQYMSKVYDKQQQCLLLHIVLGIHASAEYTYIPYATNFGHYVFTGLTKSEYFRIVRSIEAEPTL
jgi:hypothetical protein